ncbi:E3 ubiquitin-protein ligase TRAIP-like [Artemia franciscana]|uniref:E3 ubiquitin-protein ligase TRAIP-like n=1 Tax=Artemia franciscana TaxID=6661 RepID=UPI0032DB378E
MPIVYCSVCQSEVLLELGQLSAAACGHTFHSECLNKWLKEGAKTCPVCRKSTKNSLALFLDFAPENETTATNRTSNDVLRCRVESLEFQLRLKEEERKQASDKLAMLEQNKRDLRAEAKKLETLLKNEADRRRSLDSQLVFLTKELSTAVGYRDEAKRLRSQLEGLKNLKTALQGTEEDVEDMMAGYSSKSEEMKSLATFSVMLKKQLVKSQDSKGNILQELSKYQKENGALKSQVKELRSRVEILENDICLLDSEHIKHLKQNEDLKNKLKVLSKSRTSKVWHLDLTPKMYGRKNMKNLVWRQLPISYLLKMMKVFFLLLMKRLVPFY